MGKYVKYYEDVDVIELNSSVYLRIRIKYNIDDIFKECYKKAIEECGTFTSLRSSGAPTIDRVEFNGTFIETRPFRLSELTKSDTKEFLNELNNILEKAFFKYENKIKANQLAQMTLEKQIQEKRAQIDSFKDYLND